MTLTISNFFEMKEELFWQFPGILIVKDLNSVYKGANQIATQLLGFKAMDQMVGIRDDDIRCEAACFADLARVFDQKTFSGKEVKSLDVVRYADGKIWTLLDTKKLILDQNQKPVEILCHAIPLEHGDLTRIGVHLMNINRSFNKKSKIECGVFSLDNELYESYHLSKQETLCLFYLIRGKTTKMIAQYLMISNRTVETHLEHIKNKLNCKKKSELIEKAIEGGFLNAIPKGLLNFV